MTSGLHHVTFVTRRVQANVDFYAGFLGLRLVKRTAGFEDAAQLHLFYGDAAGSPGSLVTFLAWEDGSPGRVGHGQAAEIGFAVPPASIGGWLTRALAAGLRPEGPVAEFGEPVLRLRDPDGIVVKLTGAALPAAAPWTAAGIPAADALRRLRSVTLLSETPEATAGFLAAHFGLRPGPVAGGVRRLHGGAGDAVDIRDAAGFWPGLPGTGTADHVALRCPDAAALAGIEAGLRRAAEPTTVHDRRYFRSLYVRDPAGLLLECATDGPGFAVDEAAASLGHSLKMPPSVGPAAAADFALRLPQVALPGQPRPVHRDLSHVHRLHLPDDPDGSSLVLLHGTGGDETDLIPLGRRIAPRAALLALRGRSTEEGHPRWFRRRHPGARTPGDFDQADIRFEAAALDAFLRDAAAAYSLDPARLALLGYSNGANLAAALLLLHPAPRRAILLRPGRVLADPPAPDLGGTAVLTLAGSRDPFAADTAALADWLTRAGAAVTARTVPAGHGLTPEDQSIAAGWLADLYRPLLPPPSA